MQLFSVVQYGKSNNKNNNNTDGAVSLKLVSKTFLDKGVPAFHRWMQLAIWQIE